MLLGEKNPAPIVCHSNSATYPQWFFHRTKEPTDKGSEDVLDSKFRVRTVNCVSEGLLIILENKKA